ncbi:type II secretion system F family protein [Pilimelia terevasa]|uniref:type II secretion system F family protein n=1 Tax=Pilimelia terevasa TaxID=53372 RepID=UPI001663E8C2|nr:type II secretion system F family protein [Pilimelia terevasa]
MNPPQIYQSPLRRGWRWLTDKLVPAADIAVLGQTRAGFLAHMGLAALTGLIAAPTLALAASLADLDLPLVAPTAGGLGFTVGSMGLQYRGVQARAGRARAQYRRGVCVYLDQVALANAAGHGPVASLEQAAAVGVGPVFDCIREAIGGARLRLEPPWERLQQLGRDLDVPALGDLGDIMHASGTAGAHVYKTLRAKAASLRTQIRYDALSTAKASSTALDALGAALVLVLLAIAIYPFVAQLQLAT